MVLIILIDCTTIAVANLFVFCYLGEEATNHLLGFCDALFEFDWHTLPIDLQKGWLMMAINMERPHFYNGFQILHLNYEIFGKVRANCIMLFHSFCQFFFIFFNRSQN